MHTRSYEAENCAVLDLPYESDDVIIVVHQVTQFLLGELGEQWQQKIGSEDTPLFLRSLEELQDHGNRDTRKHSSCGGVTV